MDEHYRDFVVLGSGLGDGIGSESLEGVRVGLLGWEKEVRGLAGKVRVRRLEVEGAVDELREVRRQRSLAMKLVQLQSRIEDLELRLKIERLQGETGDDEDMFSEEDEDIPGDGQEENEAASKLDSLTGLVEDYEELDSLTSDASISSHPFAKLQRSRIRSIRESLVQRLEDSENASPKKTGYDSSLLDIRSLLARIQRDPD